MGYLTGAKIPIIRFGNFKSPYTEKATSRFLTRVVKPVKLETNVDYEEIGIRSHGKGIFYKSKSTKQEIGNKRVFWIEPGLFIVNIVFAWEQAIAKTTQSEVGKIASHRFPMYRPDSKQVDLDYLSWLFLTKRGKHLLELASPGGAGRNKTLGQKEFEKLKVLLPQVDEQKKVSGFINTVDKKITLLKEKHALLVKYKKGVMQKLFSQEIRFRDENGNEFPDWRELHLNQVVTPVKRRLDQAIETVLTISSKSGFLLQSDRFSQIIAGNSLEKYTHLLKGEFSYNRGNSKTYTYGCIFKLDDYEEALVPNIYRSFTLNKGSAEFFAQLFKNKHLDRQLRRLISSSARMDGLLNIGEKDFYKVKVPVPSELEQKKIGSFLDELDRKIDLVKQQIELTEEFKKGLLQQMFI
jgi:type I restriction enzyme S subunit